MTKKTLFFLKTEKLMVRNAMQIFMQNLSGSERAVYGVPYIKVIDSDGLLKLDGMEMKCIMNSLAYMSDKLKAKNLVTEANHYMSLAIYVKGKFVSFQGEFIKTLDLSNRDVVEAAI